MTPAEFRFGVRDGELVAYRGPGVLRDQVALEPELVDGFLRADDLVTHVVLLVVCVLHKDLALGEA